MNNFFTHKKEKSFIRGFLFLFSFLISLSLISASLGITNPTLPKLESATSTSISSSINYSTVNVNNSLYWQGHTGTDGSWLTGISGSALDFNTTQMENSTGELSILESWIRGIITGYNYLTTWLTPDTSNGYLSNDSTTIYFNETKLNTTYIPYNGATSNIDLNKYNITSNLSIAGVYYYQTSGACDLALNHSECLNNSGRYSIG